MQLSSNVPHYPFAPLRFTNKNHVIRYRVMHVQHQRPPLLTIPTPIRIISDLGAFAVQQ